MQSVRPVGHSIRAAAYWTLTVALIGLGTLAIFSFGIPLFVLGVTLAVLWPFRDRPRLFWTVIGAEIGFFAGYVLVAPLGCTATATPTGTRGHVECSNLLGIDYSGTMPYNPPLWPAILAATALGGMVAAVARFTVGRMFRLTAGAPRSGRS